MGQADHFRERLEYIRFLLTLTPDASRILGMTRLYHSYAGNPGLPHQHQRGPGQDQDQVHPPGLVGVVGTAVSWGPKKVTSAGPLPPVGFLVHR